MKQWYALYVLLCSYRRNYLSMLWLKLTHACERDQGMLKCTKINSAWQGLNDKLKTKIYKTCITQQLSFSTRHLQYISRIRYIALAAIIRTTILAPYLQVNSLQLGHPCWNLRVPYPQISCKDLTTWQGTRIVVRAKAIRRHALLYMLVAFCCGLLRFGSSRF